MKKRALISVSNKDQVQAFAKGLIELNYEIISTGGTLKLLQDAGIPAIGVDDITGFPEILEGRVKTLHPFIHGGLLARRDEEKHVEQLQEHEIQPIDLVAVNLYPFKETVSRKDATETDIIENIDIGGPTMLRAAAKNFAHVIAVVDPNDYENILLSLRENNVTIEERKKLAAKVFRHTAQYDALISQYFKEKTAELFPENFSITYEKVQTLRYGENPHQQAAFYAEPIQSGTSLANAKQLHGKELSFNNIQDANAALEIVGEYKDPAVVAVKHMNPCGIGVASTIEEAYCKAYEADPVSIFGGIVAMNREVNEAVAKQLNELFIEIVIAPGFTKEALDILTKKQNIRLLEIEMVQEDKQNLKLSTVKGGLLIQTSDQGTVSKEDLICKTQRQPTEEEINDLLFAWKAVKHVKSNAIVLAKNKQTIGIGAGQMNRVGAANIALDQAGEKADGAVLASDAFFPMSDTVEAAAKAGIKAIIQPGGSKRDQDSIDACDRYGIAMVFTNMRHFKH